MLDLIARRSGSGPQTHSILKHWLFGSQSLVQAGAYVQMGSHAIARGWATLLLDRL